MTHFGGAVDAQRVAADLKDRISWCGVPCPGRLGEEKGVFEFPILRGAELVTGAWGQGERGCCLALSELFTSSPIPSRPRLDHTR